MIKPTSSIHSEESSSASAAAAELLKLNLGGMHGKVTPHSVHSGLKTTAPIDTDNLDSDSDDENSDDSGDETLGQQQQPTENPLAAHRTVAPGSTTAVESLHPSRPARGAGHQRSFSNTFSASPVSSPRGDGSIISPRDKLEDRMTASPVVEQSGVNLARMIAARSTQNSPRGGSGSSSPLHGLQPSQSPDSQAISPISSPRSGSPGNGSISPRTTVAVGMRRRGMSTPAAGPRNAAAGLSPSSSPVAAIVTANGSPTRA